MKSLFFIIRKQLKNIIRSLSQKPLALIGYILIGIFLIGTLIMVLVMPSGTVRTASNELFSAGLTGLFIILLYLSLRQGIEKGSTYFRFSDVNMVFPAPLKPNQVLLYGFIKHAGASFFVVMLALFQIPNIKNNFIMADYGVVAVIIAVLFYSMLYPILGMLLYTFSSHSSSRRTLVKRVLDVAAVLFLLFFIRALIIKGSFVQALTSYLNADVFSYIPVIGQLRTIGSAAVYGIDQTFYISIFILAAIITALITIIYKINLDYYEDVLSATEQKEQRIKAKREGRDVSMQQRKVRHIRGEISSSGARAIFEKQLLEYRKASFFLFFDRTTLFIVFAGIGFKYLMPDADQDTSIFYTLFFSAYMLFFFVVQGKWPLELEKPYIYLIPESNGRKLLYTTLTENIKNFFDGALLFTTAYFLFNTSPLIIVFCILSYTMYGAVYIYGDILSRRLFGTTHSKGMQIFVKLFISFFLVLPGIIIMFIVKNTIGSDLTAVISITLWNLFAVICIFFASKGVFKNIETS